VQNLMLREEVVEAIKEAQFNIYSVDSVDEGIEILTGVPAGKRLDGGKFEGGSINDRAQKRLEQLARVMRDFGNQKEKGRKPPRRNKDNNGAD
jgi:Lon-like ATP-dependent protease